jgi:hypothetical protein
MRRWSAPAAWCAGLEENTGAGGIYGPPDAGLAGRGGSGAGRDERTGLDAGQVSRDLIARTRADGVVLNLAHWSEQEERLARGTLLSS